MGLFGPNSGSLIDVDLPQRGSRFADLASNSGMHSYIYCDKLMGSYRTLWPKLFFVSNQTDARNSAGSGA
jgi:hypothetical protein